MTVEKVKNLKWVNADWSTLKDRHIDDFSSLDAADAIDTFMPNYVILEDVNNFVLQKFGEISEKLDIPVTVLIPVLTERNKEFFKAVTDFFGSPANNGFVRNHENLLILQSLFVIPDISGIVSQVDETKVKAALDAFHSLSSTEQKEFFKKLKA